LRKFARPFRPPRKAFSARSYNGAQICAPYSSGTSELTTVAYKRSSTDKENVGTQELLPSCHALGKNTRDPQHLP
jgi:hypothetical protein